MYFMWTFIYVFYVYIYVYVCVVSTESKRIGFIQLCSVESCSNHPRQHAADVKERERQKLELESKYTVISPLLKTAMRSRDAASLLQECLCPSKQMVRELNLKECCDLWDSFMLSVWVRYQKQTEAMQCPQPRENVLKRSFILISSCAPESPTVSKRSYENY